MRTRLRLLVSPFLGLLVAAACSGGGGGSDAGSDAQSDVAVADSAKDTGADAGAVCTANPTYSGALTQQAATYSPTPADAGADAGPQDSYQYQGAYNTDPDLLDIELYDGYGVFTGGIQPGTYALTGAELNYGTCGLCVLVIGNASQSGGDPYMATGGSITITSVSPTGTFAGSGTNLTFTHVSVDPNTQQSTPLNDGCNSAIASVSFSATVTTQ